MKLNKQILSRLSMRIFQYVILLLFFISVLISSPNNAYAIVYQPGQTLNPTCLPTSANCGVTPPLTLSSATTTVTASAASFTATSSSASTLPYASTTAISVSGGNATTSSLTLGSVNGILRAIAGVVQATYVNLASDITGVLSVLNGGTGISTAPSYGKVLLGNASGGYNLVATSSLGISGTGGSTSPGGSSNQIQFNNSGAFGASSALTFNSTSGTLSATNGSFTSIAASSLSVTGTTNLATTTASKLLTANKGIALASSIPSATTNTLYNSGNTLYWNGTKILQSLGTSLLSLNGLSTSTQFFATGKGGSDFKITSAGNTHIFSIPNAGPTFRGFVSTTTQTLAGEKSFTSTTTMNVLSMNTTRITGLALPVATTDATNKAYVDAITQGISWQAPVIALATTSAPVSPATGDRYVIESGATSFGTCTTNQIASWSGSAWTCSTPSSGWSVYVNQIATNYNFNNTAWVSLGSTINHNNLLGLQGGQSSQYYHLDLPDYNAVHTGSPQLLALQTTGAPSFQGLTITSSSTLPTSFSVTGVTALNGNTTITGGSTVTATTTTQGLSATFAYITTGVINKLTSSIATLTNATIATLTGSTANIGTATIGTLTATSSLAVAGNTTLTNASSTNQTISGYLNVAGDTTLATTTASKLLTANKGIALASSTPLSTTNALYNKGNVLYWNGLALAVSTVGVTGTAGQTIVINSSGAQTATSSLFVASNKNVGIGTTAPADKLDVLGSVNIKSGSAYKLNGANAITASTTLSNYFFGNSGNLTMTGSSNTAIGNSSLALNTTGSNNVTNGASSLFTNTTGSSNTANGSHSLYSNTTGFSNTTNGAYSLYSNTTGSKTTAEGMNTLYYNTSATSSVAVGYGAARGNNLYNNQGGVYLGSESGYNASTGSDYNTFLGYNSGYGVTTGARNILIGASLFATSKNQITTGSNNISIGYNTVLPSAGASNQLDIGNTIYGNTSVHMIGIGTTSPLSTLDVFGNVTLSGANRYLNFGTTTVTSLSGYGFRDNGGTLQFKNKGDSWINFSAGGAFSLTGNSVYVTNTANDLGIGTTSPKYKLDVGGFINTDKYSGYKQEGNTILYASSTNLSTLVGQSAGAAMSTTGSNNTAVGNSALKKDTTGSYNTAVGASALYGNTTGASNTANGFYTLFSNTVGSNNTASGRLALFSNTTGNYNTANGYSSLNFNTAGSKNTVSGYSALSSNNTGSNNIAIGFSAGSYLTKGDNNTIIGGNSIYFASSTASNQLNIGNILYGTNIDGSGSTISTGNVGIGTVSPTNKLDVAGSINISTGSAYKYNGANAITASTTLSNYFFGNSGNLTMTGSSNTASGINALASNTTGIDNTANGTYALSSNSTGNQNTANGQAALYYNTTGYQNVAIGNTAGAYIAGGATANAISTNSTYLGVNTKALANGDVNETVIGYNATGAGSNSVVLGNSSVIKTILNGNVGIGTTSPAFNLEVAGTDTKIEASGSAGAAIYLNKTGTTPGWSEWQQTGDRTRLNANGAADLLTILNTGNVAIGSATAAQKLTVNGGITAKAGLPGASNTNGTGYSFSSPGDTDGGMFSTADGTLQFLTNSNTIMTIDSSGRVGIGTAALASTFTVAGSSCFSVGAGATVTCGTAAGNIYYTTANTGNYDVAEKYRTYDTSLRAGDVITLDTKNAMSVERATSSDASFIGVVSTAPGVLLGGSDGGAASTTVPVALSGRVPVKVSLENGPIAIGDRLSISSTTPGVAVKLVGNGSYIGQALESYTGTATSTTGTVTVLINSGLYYETSSANSTGEGTFFGRITKWLASATNGIGAITANVFKSNEVDTKRLNANEICVSDSSGAKTCITKTQLDVLLSKAAVSSSANSKASVNGSTSSGNNNSNPIASSSATSTDTVSTATPPATKDTKKPVTSSTTPLTISAIKSTTTQSTATIEWKTNKDSKSVVDYGTSTTYASSTQEGSLSKSHKVTIDNLLSNTGYHFRIVSNSASSTATSSDSTFKTLSVPDTTPPTITLLGSNPMDLAFGAAFTDPGATAKDAVDGDITGSIATSSSPTVVDTSKAGTYTITYTVSDKSGNKAKSRRSVVVAPAK